MLHPHDIYSELEPWTIRILSFAREFVNKGHEVRLGYFPLNPGESLQPGYLDNIMAIPFSRKISIRTLIKNMACIRKELEWADVVHFQKCHHYAAIPLLIASFVKNKPLHYDWDDWEKKIFIHSNKKTPTIILVYILFSVLERLIPECVDTISVSSDKLYQLCLGMGIPKERIFMAPVGADLEKFNPDVTGAEIKKKYNFTGPVVLYLGQLHGGQYVELFMRAANLVLKQGSFVNFMIVGGGSRFEDMRSIARGLGMEKNILFTNSLPQEVIPAHIACADICVACFEDNDVTRCKSPLKIAEYLASAKAIVASNVGEVRKMVGGVGLLSEPGNAADLSEAIIKLLNNDLLRKEMGLRARKRSEIKYNWKITAGNILKAYQFALFLNNKTVEEIIIPARDFSCGNVSKTNNSFGKGLLVDDGVFPCFVEYEFYIPSSGIYELWVKYAQELSRPGKIYFDAKLLCAEALLETTGGWTKEKTIWFKQVDLAIESKFHSIKLLFERHCPHLEFIKLKKIA